MCVIFCGVAYTGFYGGADVGFWLFCIVGLNFCYASKSI